MKIEDVGCGDLVRLCPARKRSVGVLVSNNKNLNSSFREGLLAMHPKDVAIVITMLPEAGMFDVYVMTSRGIVGWISSYEVEVVS